jgi:acyl-coenzyme A thioesterase PaaI-like protein
MDGRDVSDSQNQATMQLDHANETSALQQQRSVEHPHCFVCEPHRPFGLRMAYVVDDDGSVKAVFDCPKLWQGYPGMVHGGIIASILDGAMTHCLFARQIAGVTADLQVRYRHPLLLGELASVRAKVTRDMSPVYVLEASIIQGNVVRSTAVGKFMDRRFVREIAHL